MVEKLMKKGMEKEDIAVLLDISIDEIEELLKEK
jgi:hypothetical protein